MDPNSWTRFTSSNSPLKRYQSRPDAFHLVEETDDETRPEYLCPFCAEDFDIVGLCCHIDEEHTVQAKNGVCPICAKRVGTGLVTHITMQHGNLLKVQRKRRLRRGGSNSNSTTLSILKKELREGNLQSVLGGSSFLMNTDPDPLLSSFIYNNTPDELSKDQFQSSTSAVSVMEGSNKDILTRSEKQKGGMVCGEDEEEKSRRSEFVQGLVLSTFFNVDL